MNDLIKDTFYIILMFIAVWFSFYLYTRHDTLEQKMARYDCRISEFDPGFPPEVRAECRRRAIELYNQQQSQAKE